VLTDENTDRDGQTDRHIAKRNAVFQWTATQQWLQE